MDILYRLRGACFVGVLRIAKWLRPLKPKRSTDSVTNARIAAFWSQEMINRLTTHNLLFPSAKNGTETGTNTGIGYSLVWKRYPSSVKAATKLKQIKKIKRGKNNGNLRGTRRRA